MKKIEAITLEEAYAKASKEFNCSITNLDIEVIQSSKKGFLGIGKKSAIIVATNKTKPSPKERIKPKPPELKPEIKEVKVKKEPKKHIVKKEKESTTIINEPKVIKEVKETRTSKEAQSQRKNTNSDIFNNFYGDKKNLDEIAKEIEEDLRTLFNFGCFGLDKIRVSPEDSNTLLIEFDGKDAALLIGKEGYRYKALSYMLFNWINPKYNLMVKLEIAEFLKNQEDMIKNYLAPLIDNINSTGYGQTKPLDGVLAHIALKQLRTAFPNKYVVTKENDNSVKYVVITDFKR